MAFTGALGKRQPEGDAWRHVERIGHAGGESGRAQAVDGLRLQYALEAGGGIELLDDAQWPDWDDWNRQGRLLVATRSGRRSAWPTWPRLSATRRQRRTGRGSGDAPGP